ncbi:MAG: hypothetical protein IJ713_04650 [Oscillibacter sp.]|nr:hypothetical protein [Oscillibacter sp.]
MRENVCQRKGREGASYRQTGQKGAELFVYSQKSIVKLYKKPGGKWEIWRVDKSKKDFYNEDKGA